MADMENKSKQESYNVDFTGRQIDSVSAERVDLNQCSVQSVQAEKVTMDKSATAFMVAEKIEASNSAVLVMLAREASGDIRPIISLSGAMIIAGAVLLGFAIFRRN